MKNTLFLLLLTLIVLPSVLSAQDSLFAFAHSRRSARFAPKPVSNYKLETARKIYMELIQARGDARMIEPTFVMNKGERFIAWMDPIKGEIGLEEKAYDVCVKLGKDSLVAMAALIAHEITHYYEKHDWNRHFASLHQDLDAGARIARMEEGLKYETQADYLGGILAISAGYNTYSVFNDFLILAYKEYRYPEQIEGYPSLEERLKINNETAGRLRELHNVYQTANLLTLFDAPDIANQYYKYLLADYQSYEVFNNAGINACLAALKLMDPHEIPYTLPLELDMTSRLDELVTRLPKDAEKQRIQLLHDAERWFKNATQLAAEEPVAYLNLAVVYILMDEWFDAAFWAGKALALSRKHNKPKQAADAQIAQGVIAGLQGKKEEANTQFTLALSGNNYLASLNLSILEGKRSPKLLERSEAKGVEKIEDLFLDDFLQNMDIDVTAELSDRVFCGKHTMKHSELLLHYANDGEQYILFHQTNPNYKGETQWGLQLGDSRENILKTYKAPSKTFELTNGSCLMYKDKKILFILDENDRLQKWVVFTSNL